MAHTALMFSIPLCTETLNPIKGRSDDEVTVRPRRRDVVAADRAPHPACLVNSTTDLQGSVDYKVSSVL